MKEWVREKQAGECVLAMGRRQVDGQQAHHVWWSREPQKCAQTCTHMNTGDTRAHSLLSPPLHSTSCNTTSGNVYVKQNILCRSYQPKGRILKVEREKENPSQGQDGADMFGGTPIENPLFHH